MTKPHYPTRTDTRLTSGFGWRTHPVTKARTHHDGIDLAPRVAGTRGVPVYATEDGTVVESIYHNVSGNRIYIKGKQSGLYTVYLHLESRRVNNGQHVKRGQVIGIMGTTGQSTGIHLHFGVSNGFPRWSVGGRIGNFINPHSYLAMTFEVSANSGLDWFAQEVKRGRFGNGHLNRMNGIYKLVRDRVNGKGSQTPFEDVVQAVRRGEYGNGHIKRKEAIYDEVRKRVNR